MKIEKVSKVKKIFNLPVNAIFFIILMGFYCAPALGLTPSFSVNFFEPTIDDSDFFTIYDSKTMSRGAFHAGAYLDYAYRPYEFGDIDFNRREGIVDHLLTANVVGSYAILDWFEAGLVIPVHLYEGLDSPTLGLDEGNFALGDVKLVMKFRLLDRTKHGVGIAVVPYLGFPTSTNSKDFLGDGRFSGGGKVVIDGRIKDRVSIALNVGYNVQNRVFDVGGNDIDDEFLLGLGISGDIFRKLIPVGDTGDAKVSKFAMIGEIQSSTVVRNFYSDRRTTPVEARVGFRYTWANNHDVNLGGGFGITNGISSPAFRVFAGYTYTQRPLAKIQLPEDDIPRIRIGDELTAQDKIYFDFDKATIREISKPTLDKIAGFLKANPEVTKIRIDGYTCDLGKDSYNQKLSQRRANSVARYLESQGVAADRISTVVGHGEADPLMPNTDEANREQNRRVQIFVDQTSY